MNKPYFASSLLLVVTFILFSPLVVAGKSDLSRFESIDIPRYMVSGDRYPVSLSFKNIGTSNWAKNKYRLVWANGSPAADGWKMDGPDALFKSVVEPGDMVTLEFEVIAPSKTGRFDLAWQLQDSAGNPFGEQAKADSIRVEKPDDQSHLEMQLVPDQVSVGEHFTALIQMKNIGQTTWSREQGFYLATVDSIVWGVDKLELQPTAHVAPGETATFKARLVAPLLAGEHRLQWQMRHKNTAFGDITPLVKVRVGRQVVSVSDAEFVYQDVGNTMLAGDTHEVALQFKNTSGVSWRAGEVSLVSADVKDLLWAIDSVELKPGEVIAPGEFAVFRFNVQAPFEAGKYPFQWRLRHKRDGFFGVPSERLLIDVK